MNPLHASVFTDLPKNTISHGFFTREGGVSTGLYRSLNLGQNSADKPKNIMINHARVSAYFGGFPLIIPNQTHSNIVEVIDTPPSMAPKSDALVTCVPKLILGVLSADCGPLLFADPKEKIVAAAHVGWRGALSGIIENTITQMICLGAHPEHIIAVLGPSLSPSHYQVGEEFLQKFLNQSSDYVRFFNKDTNKGRYHFDLWSFIMARLERAKVKAQCIKQCTYEDETRFFSYRRMIHHQEEDYGRQVSAIMLRGR
ncbi:peptidoglycan editing factor PgeF [Bartonella sp. DGB2]|uniref:peptidoglycan editing factor PgeF n=1 Tax=Bartonella sp. DGB2 TaxID=3388426 RepID=UPI00398FEACC